MCWCILLASLVPAAGRTPSAWQVPEDGGQVLVFAAASLQTALDALVPGVRSATGVQMRVSYAGTSILARQIERGAPADLFISADLDWMDYLESRDAIQAGSRTDLLGNRLVLVAPRGRAPDLAPGVGFPLAGALGGGRLAVADTEAVPAGRYARAALESLDVWDEVSGRLAPAENVRVALLLVSRGEAPLGIVYRSDALSDSGVEIVGTFPETSHPPIVYPVAVTRDAPNPAAARRVLDYLGTDDAHEVFVRHGFE